MADGAVARFADDPWDDPDAPVLAPATPEIDDEQLGPSWDEIPEELPPTSADQLRRIMLHGAAIEDVPPPEPLVAGWLDLESLAVLYGRPKAGKSFVALDVALCVATGSFWHGREVRRGPVVYVVAEGLRGVGPRVKAWRHLNRHHAAIDDVHWIPRAVNLLHPEWPPALAEVCAELQPVLVVIDTLNRSMAGGDENSSKDMGAFIAGVDLVKRETGACVFVVHHSGKDAAAGARGHSSLLGALDTELEVKNAGDGIVMLANSEQKDHAEADSLRFVLAPAADSVAIAPYTGHVPGGDEGMSMTARQVLVALRSVATDEGASSSEWEAAAAADGVSRASFFRARKQLLETSHVSRDGLSTRGRYMPSDQGEPT